MQSTFCHSPRAGLCGLLAVVIALAAPVVRAEDREEPYAYARAGDSLFALGAVDQADAQYQKALALAKEFQAGTAPREEGLCLANYGLARVALTRDQAADAEKFLKSCKDKPKYETIYLLGMGLTRQEQGKLDEAESLLIQGASRADQTRGDAPPDAARLEMADTLVSIALVKDLPLIAVERLNDRAVLTPTDATPLIRKGRLLVASKQYDEARDAFGQAIGVDSTAADAYKEIASLYARAKRPADAAKVLERLANVAPTPDNLIAAGSAWEAAGQADKAAELFGRATTSAPESPQARLGLARAVYTSGDRARAVTIFQSIDKSLLTGKDWLSVADALREQKDYATARQAYMSAFERDSTLVDALFYAGQTHYLAKEYAEAIPYYQRRVAIDSTSTAAFTNLGLCYLQTGRTAEGAAELATAARLTPGDARSHIWLAQALAMQSKWDGAAAEYQKVADMDPQNAEAWRGLGFVNLSQGRVGPAIELLTKANQLEPDNVQGLIWLAQGHAMSENYQTAKSLFGKAISIDPSSQEARQGYQAVDEVMQKQAKQKKRRGSS